MRTIKHNLGNKDGVFTVSFRRESKVGGKVVKGPQEKAEFFGVALNAPADIEALDAWHAGKEFTFGDEETGTVTFKGSDAAAAAKVLHDIESVRGKAREKLAGGASVESVGKWLRATMIDYTPKVSLSVTVVSVETDEAVLKSFMDRGDFEGLKAYLAKQGAGIKPQTDEERIAAEAQRMADAVDARLNEESESEEDEEQDVA